MPQQIHFSKDFDPPSEGLYQVLTNHKRHHSPHIPYEIDETDGGRFAVLNLAFGMQVWLNKKGLNKKRGHWSRLFVGGFEDFLKEFYPDDEITGWIGPYAHHRKCFRCDKPIFPMECGEDPEHENVRYALQADGAADFSSSGHYGCTYIDSIGDGEEVRILVCDYCLRANAEAVLWCDVRRDGSRHNFRTGAEEVERYNQFHAAKIEIMEAAGYKWMDFDGDFLPSDDPKKIDVNKSGWYAKGWQPCRETKTYHDGSIGYPEDSKERHAWMQCDPETASKIENLRQEIWGQECAEG